MVTSIFRAGCCALALSTTLLLPGQAEAQVTISCDRGPTRSVIWDRPLPVFIDSLIATGYDITTATAIAERVCRDESVVNKPEAMVELTRKLMAETPRRR